MNNDSSYIPTLTLDPAATQSAVAEAPKPAEEKVEAPVEKLDISNLSPAEQAAVRDFAEKIDILDFSSPTVSIDLKSSSFVESNTCKYKSF